MSILSPILSAAKYLPANSAVGLVKRAFPSLKKFFESKALSGFTANQILDYLTERSEDKTFLHRLGKLEGQNLLTPEEKILHRKEKEREATGNIAKNLIGFGLGSADTSEDEGEERAEDEIISPMEIINKQSPLGIGHNRQKRISGPMYQKTGEGTVINVSPTEEQALKAAQGGNVVPQHDPLAVIMQRYPELAQFIQKGLQEGFSPSDIARRARTNPFSRKYGPMIDDIESQIDEPFEILLERILGGQKRASAPQQAPGAQAQTQNSEMQTLLSALQQLRKMRGG